VTSIAFHSVSKSYAIYDGPGDRLKELLSPRRRKRHRDFWALRDVSFDVQRGETFCIVGENGSGKSTLLQIVAGILEPTSGSAAVAGRMAALLELGAGFNPEFTGRDNVYLNASILGFNTRQIDERYDEIVAFADIGEFIHQRVKTYSNGMVVRLAFAVAIHVEPEILLVDEALAVGDFGFRQRAIRKVHELRARGVTILFVSHSMGDIKAVGDRVLWLDHGQVADLGEPDQVVARYSAAMTKKDTNFQRLHSTSGGSRGSIDSGAVVDTIPNIDHRHGDGRAEVIGIATFNENGDPVHTVQPGAQLLVRISVRARDEVPEPVVGFMLRNRLGIDFFGTDTTREGCPLRPLHGGDILTIDFNCDLPELYPASFSFSPSISDGAPPAATVCDWIDNALAIQMETQPPVYGYVHFPCRIEINSRLSGTGPEPLSLLENSGG